MLGHPVGLFILFFTEMWERFSYYGMRAILVLYLVAQTDTGGLAWSDAEALSLYGWYTMLVYLMSIPGGILADTVLGQKKAVMLGGALLVAGHSLMAVTHIYAFYGALALIVLGVGLLKPNISTMVGGLYQRGDGRRDAAFTIFYMGINIGAFLASLIVGYVGEEIGWHYGFGLAGIGMALGQIVFIAGQKHLKDVGNLEPKTAANPSVGLDAFRGFSKEDWHRIYAILISFLIVIVFWAAFEQAGGFLTLYAERFTNRVIPMPLTESGVWEMPTSWFQALNPLFIVVFGGVMSGLWMFLARRGKEPSSISKMGLGTVIMGLGFALMVGASLERGAGWLQTQVDENALSNLWWLVGAYWFHTIGELALSPVSLSFITKVSPKKVVATMMGLYFAVTGLANKVAALVGTQAAQYGEMAVFVGIATVSILLGILLMLFSKQINRLTHEKQGV